MSHYYTDPIHPFHTAQSSAENNIHRAVEWSISKSYDAHCFSLRCRKPVPRIAHGYRATTMPGSKIMSLRVPKSLIPTMRHLIAHYNFDRGVVEPPEGLDDVCKELISELHCLRGCWARQACSTAHLNEAGVDASRHQPDSGNVHCHSQNLL